MLYANSGNTLPKSHSKWRSSRLAPHASILCVTAKSWSVGAIKTLAEDVVTSLSPQNFRKCRMKCVVQANEDSLVLAVRQAFSSAMLSTHRTIEPLEVIQLPHDRPNCTTEHIPWQDNVCHAIATTLLHTTHSAKTDSSQNSCKTHWTHLGSLCTQETHNSQMQHYSTHHIHRLYGVMETANVSDTTHHNTFAWRISSSLLNIHERLSFTS